jgi:hypothetical protein
MRLDKDNVVIVESLLNEWRGKYDEKYPNRCQLDEPTESCFEDSNYQQPDEIDLMQQQRKEPPLPPSSLHELWEALMRGSILQTRNEFTNEEETEEEIRKELISNKSDSNSTNIRSSRPTPLQQHSLFQSQVVSPTLSSTSANDHLIAQDKLIKPSVPS